MIQYKTICYDLIQNDMIWDDTKRYDKMQYDYWFMNDTDVKKDFF